MLVTYNTSSILATICSAQARSFSKVTRSLSLSTSSLVSSLSAKVSPMLLFCLKGTGGMASSGSEESISLIRFHSHEFLKTGTRSRLLCQHTMSARTTEENIPEATSQQSTDPEGIHSAQTNGEVTWGGNYELSISKHSDSRCSLCFSNRDREQMLSR